MLSRRTQGKQIIDISDSEEEIEDIISSSEKETENNSTGVSIDIENKTNFEKISSSDCDDLTESENVIVKETCEVQKNCLEEERISNYESKGDDKIVTEFENIIMASIQSELMSDNEKETSRMISSQDIETDKSTGVSIDIENTTNFEVVSSSDCDDLTESEKIKFIETCEVKKHHLEEDSIFKVVSLHLYYY